MSAQLYGELCLRLVAALLAGGVVGLQRALAGKEAGMRTHMLVAFGAALMMIVSAYAFRDLGNREPTRLAAQIVTGIGFIGGGMILKEGSSIRGLTTAASMWAVTGIGLATGGGLLPLALVGTLLTLLTLGVLGRLEYLIPELRVATWSLDCTLGEDGSSSDLEGLLRRHSRDARVTGYMPATPERRARLALRVFGTSRFDPIAVTRELSALGILDIAWRADAVGEDLV